MEFTKKLCTRKLPNSKIKYRRGQGKKNSRKNGKGKQSHEFSLLGTNSAGLNSKKESLFSLVNRFTPSVITIQETKLSKIGSFQIPGYQIFEKKYSN